MESKSLLTLTVAFFVLSRPASAQMVSVRCCSSQADLEKVGNCISGPGDPSRPPACAVGATCVLGFGANVETMGGLCDPDRPTIPDLSRGYCSSWADEEATIEHECVALPSTGISLFEVFDDDQDGDFDLLDLAMFFEAYNSVPKQIQSDARLVSLECCVPESVIRDIGVCLFGPGGGTIPAACTHDMHCTVGFSLPVEVGDYLYRLCASGLSVTPDLSDGICTFWQDPATPSAFECPVSKRAGLSLFVVSDADDDGDVDLRDFSVFQRESEFP